MAKSKLTVVRQRRTEELPRIIRMLRRAVDGEVRGSNNSRAAKMARAIEKACRMLESAREPRCREMIREITIRDVIGYLLEHDIHEVERTPRDRFAMTDGDGGSILYQRRGGVWRGTQTVPWTKPDEYR